LRQPCFGSQTSLMLHIAMLAMLIVISGLEF
jgi:hypothetical protein